MFPVLVARERTLHVRITLGFLCTMTAMLRIGIAKVTAAVLTMSPVGSAVFATLSSHHMYLPFRGGRAGGLLVKLSYAR